MLNLSDKTYVVIIIFCIALVVSGCGSQNGDIAPIEPKAEAISETMTPTSSTEIADPASLSPISPVSPVKEAIMEKIGNIEPIKGSEKALTAAIADLTEQTGIQADKITLMSMEAVEWSDSSLGCPQEGFMYAQVITPGYLIVLEADGESYSYHTDQEGSSVVLCEEE
jgi:hypothetical protein